MTNHMTSFGELPQRVITEEIVGRLMRNLKSLCREPLDSYIELFGSTAKVEEITSRKKIRDAGSVSVVSSYGFMITEIEGNPMEMVISVTLREGITHFGANITELPPFLEEAAQPRLINYLTTIIREINQTTEVFSTKISVPARELIEKSGLVVKLSEQALV